MTIFMNFAYSAHFDMVSFFSTSLVIDIQSELVPVLFCTGQSRHETALPAADPKGLVRILIQINTGPGLCRLVLGSEHTSI